MNPAINEAAKQIELPEDFKMSLASMPHIKIIGKGNSGRSLVGHAIAHWLTDAHNYTNNIFIEDESTDEEVKAYRQDGVYDLALWDETARRANINYNNVNRSVCMMLARRCELNTLDEFEKTIAIKVVPGTVITYKDGDDIHVWYRGCKEVRAHFKFKNPFVA